MTKSKSRTLSLALEERIRDLKRLNVLLASLLVVAVGGLVLMPQFITINVPPNARQGFSQKVGEIHPATVYNTAFAFFQNINYWSKDGSKDMLNNLSLYQFLISANFKNEMTLMYRSRVQKNDIAGKTRTIQEMPGAGYSLERVTQLTDTSWVVFIDTIVEESYKGRLYMRKGIRWPLIVTLGSTHEEYNPWGIRLDGFDSTPKEIPLPKGLTL